MFGKFSTAISESALLRSILPEEPQRFTAQPPSQPAQGQEPHPSKSKSRKEKRKHPIVAHMRNLPDPQELEDSDEIDDGHDIEQTREGMQSGELTWWQKSKIGLLLFFAFIVLSSNIFLEHFLQRWRGAVDPALHTSTSYGTIIQGILLVISYVIFDIIVTANVV